MSDLKWFVVYIEEFSGYDCNGHESPYLVAANSKEEAEKMFASDSYGEPRRIAVEFALIDLRRRKKPFVMRWPK